MRTQLTAYQATVRDLHDQNNRNAELLGRLETMVTDKEAEISRLRTEEMQKDLRIEAQQRDFQNQLIAEQTAHQQVSGTLELLRQELETLKSDQHNQNPMDISSSTDTVSELNRIKQQAEQEKRANEEKLAKLKAEHEQLLQNKNCEITSEIERIKQNMEEQMRKERELTAKANEVQMQTIMSELRALKENQVKDTTDRKVGEKVLLDNIKASIDPILKSDFKSGEPISIGARLKGLQEEVNNYCPPTVNKKRGAAISTDDTIADWTLGRTRDTRHVHFASTPVKSNISNININVTPPRASKEDTLAESLLQNTMQTLASEFKRSREPKIQKFRGGTSTGTLLVFKSLMQDIECTIKDRNLSTDEAIRLVKEFSEGSAKDNINFYLEITDNPTIEGLFDNLKQVFSIGEDGQQMLAEFYSRSQGSKESVKEFGESLLQIARKIMTAKPEFKTDIDNTLKARFADGLKDHYHQAIAHEMIRSQPTLSYVVYKAEVLKTLGPNIKPRSITVNKLDTSDVESPPKKRKRDSELDQKINATLEENHKLSERLSAFDPKTIADTVINAVQSNTQVKKTYTTSPKPYKPSQFYGKPKEPELVPGTDGSLKPDKDCNYCKDLGHLKYNCPKLKAKEAKLAGEQYYERAKQGN